MKSICWLRLTAVAIVATIVVVPQDAVGEVLITELSSKSANDPEDYFELTNTGAAAVDLSGWAFDDESADLAESAPLNLVTSIAPGESVVFFQLDENDPLEPAYDPAAEVVTFRGFWGGLDGVQVGWHGGAGLGKGDAITLFDAGGGVALSLEYGMTSPEQTHAGDWAAGNTDGSDTYETGAAVWVPGTDPQEFVLSAPGVYGSFANTSGEYGSPGTASIPEPSALLIVATAALIGIGSRRS